MRNSLHLLKEDNLIGLCELQELFVAAGGWGVGGWVGGTHICPEQCLGEMEGKCLKLVLNHVWSTCGKSVQS